MSAADVNEVIRKSNDRAESTESSAINRKVQHSLAAFDLNCAAKNADSEHLFDLEPKPKSTCIAASQMKERPTNEMRPPILDPSDNLDKTWSVIYLSQKHEM